MLNYEDVFLLPEYLCHVENLNGLIWKLSCYLTFFRS